ncbi:hypothetical protein [Vibrio casei]|uniref:hypothetical protein n=1 Tax=Vibrio casei TaxID=673372 RepID=UPI000DA66A4E|nr:hypothetical protein [Vibrio casei]
MKLIKKEFDDVVLQASKLKQSTVNIELFKLSKILVPCVGILSDQKDSPDLYTILFSIVAQKSSVEHFESLQTLLLSTLVNDDLEHIQDIDQYLEDKGINSLDVFMWLFQAQLIQPLQSTQTFKVLQSHFDDIKETFFPSLGITPTPTE